MESALNILHFLSVCKLLFISGLFHELAPILVKNNVRNFIIYPVISEESTKERICIRLSMILEKSEIRLHPYPKNK